MMLVCVVLAIIAYIFVGLVLARLATPYLLEHEEIAGTAPESPSWPAFWACLWPAMVFLGLFAIVVYVPWWWLTTKWPVKPRVPDGIDKHGQPYWK